MRLARRATLIRTLDFSLLAASPLRAFSAVRVASVSVPDRREVTIWIARSCSSRCCST